MDGERGRCRNYDLSQEVGRSGAGTGWDGTQLRSRLLVQQLGMRFQLSSFLDRHGTEKSAGPPKPFHQLLTPGAHWLDGGTYHGQLRVRDSHASHLPSPHNNLHGTEYNHGILHAAL